MFFWCIPQNIQPFIHFEFTKIFIDSLLNILHLLVLRSTTSIFTILQWEEFYTWYITIFHIFLKLCKLPNNVPSYFDCLVLRSSRRVINFAIVNAHQVAVCRTLIRLYDEGSATISPFSFVAVCYSSLFTNFSWLAIPLNLTDRVRFVLEHPSLYFLTTVVCQLQYVPLCGNLRLKQQ